MKFIHTSDLHIGKKLHEADLLSEQRAVLHEIVEITKREKADGLIIAGDVFDRSTPSGEALNVYDDFMTELGEANIPVYMVSGNHDSAERLNQCSHLLRRLRVMISPRFQEHGILSVPLEDEWGKINIHLIPYLTPFQVKVRYDLEKNPETWTDAMKTVIDSLDIDKYERNIAVVHQFIENSETSESEVNIQGGLDAISSSVFRDFDYVALGHLHKAQRAGGDHIRYSGTPLKYSFSEKDDTKSVTVLELKEKGNLEVGTIPLEPLTDLVEYRGSFEEIIDGAKSGKLRTDSFTKITLTDDGEVLNAFSRLREKFPKLLDLRYEKTEESYRLALEATEKIKEKTPKETVSEFWQAMNDGKEMNEEEARELSLMMDEIWRS